MTTENVSKRAVVFAARFAAACAAIGAFLGLTYIGRLPHHEGYHLVAVDDEVKVAIPARPRHVVVIVVDGLRADAAETMESTRRLARAGHCRTSDQGSYTVSRPVYALLSTGLEVDRSGSRNNEQTAPLAAESIWTIARDSRLRVTGSSHLPWFRQLSPNGFDEFRHAKSHDENVFEGVALADLSLFHPLYVDEAGHQHGAASAAYRAAVTRADCEIAGLGSVIRTSRRASSRPRSSGGKTSSASAAKRSAATPASWRSRARST